MIKHCRLSLKSDWLAEPPSIVRLDVGGTVVVVTRIGDAGLEQVLSIPSGSLRSLVKDQLPQPEGRLVACAWRFVSAAVPSLPGVMENIGVLDHLLGRSDRREPLVVATSVESGTITRVINIPSDLYWFEGHFHGDPILPGLLQLKFAIEMAGALGGITGQPRTIRQLKFKAPIRPDSVVALSVTSVGLAEVGFTFHSGDGEHSSGRLCYRSV